MALQLWSLYNHDVAADVREALRRRRREHPTPVSNTTPVPHEHYSSSSHGSQTNASAIDGGASFPLTASSWFCASLSLRRGGGVEGENSSPGVLKSCS